MELFRIYQASSKQFISATQAGARLGVTSRRIRVLANQGRVVGALFHQNLGWQFYKPDLAVRPGARGPAFGINKKSRKKAQSKAST